MQIVMSGPGARWRPWPVGESLPPPRERSRTRDPVEEGCWDADAAGNTGKYPHLQRAQWELNSGVYLLHIFLYVIDIYIYSDAFRKQEVNDFSLLPLCCSAAQQTDHPYSNKPRLLRYNWLIGGHMTSQSAIRRLGLRVNTGVKAFRWNGAPMMWGNAECECYKRGKGNTHAIKKC